MIFNTNIFLIIVIMRITIIIITFIDILFLITHYHAPNAI